MHSESPIKRRVSRKIWVGSVPVGGDAPIAVQSMTNTDTHDVAATVAQIQRLEAAGADIVRVSVPDMDAAEAFGRIKQQVKVPLVADIHFDYQIACGWLSWVSTACASTGQHRSRRPRTRRGGCRPRQGHPDTHRRQRRLAGEGPAEEIRRADPASTAGIRVAPCGAPGPSGLPDFKVSVKASDVFMAVEAYRLLARQITQPLHLGITEAGGLRSGTVKSAVGLGMLLAEGIGDTIRISLAADPVEEIKVGFDILKSLRLRSRGINFIACPSCSRQNFDVVKTMNELEQRVEDLLVPLDVAVIGCVVNGPGEAKEAHIGLTGGTPNLVYIDGKPAQKLTNDNLVDELEQLIRRKAAEKQAADAAVIARS